jgi:SAM-dependent methyltransferase
VTSTPSIRIVTAARAAAKNILGPRLTAIVRRPFRRKLRSISDYRIHLASKSGLEIGGPSAILGPAGQIPIYEVLKSLDNCLYSGSTIWTGEVREGNTFRYHPAKPPGAQIVCEAADLHSIKDSSYECVLASHCLEHVANPLRALAEWKRVLKNDGILLLILPHKDGTFDWRRPATPLGHMIEDYENGVGEGDLTHLPEILELHDLSKDPGAGSKEQFRQRCLANNVTRAMHHHVFDTMAALAILNHMGLKIIRVDHLKPFHMIILAKRTDAAVDNSAFMESNAGHWKRSPFPSDYKLAESERASKSFRSPLSPR